MIASSASFPFRCLWTVWALALALQGATPSAGVPVDPAVARIAAADMLPVFYGGPWAYYTNVTYYDLDGRVNAYGFVFRRSDTNAVQSADVERMISSGRKELRELESQYARREAATDAAEQKKSAELNDIEAKIIQAQMKMCGEGIFATLITNTDDAQPVVRNCYLGLPAALVKKQEACEWLDVAQPGGRYRLDRFLCVGPFDDAYELVPAKPGDMLPPSVLDMRTHRVEALKDLREKRRELEQERQGDSDARALEQNREVWRRYLRQSLREKGPHAKRE
jgi:hypothetical protein